MRLLSLLLLVTAMLLGSTATAHADPSTGLWPDISIPAKGNTPPAEESKDGAVIVGIDRYDALPRIPGAADNARDWEKFMLFGRRVPPDRVRLLTDQNATVEAIKSRAKEVTAAMPEGGTLFVIFIGHGAPADGGQKGLLLGADVRPSDSSFAARSLSYDQLLEITNQGKQGRTTMVLDACFSGISNKGKTLLTNVQPVVAVSLLSAPKTTVFSAGTAAEYAGSLPGSERPALSYLLLGTMRGWGDRDHDGKVTAHEALEYTSLVMRSLPNNHEQHPQMSTDAESEALTEGKETEPDLADIRSKLDTWKPVEETGPAPPKLRLAASCDGSPPQGPDDGMTAYLDNSPAVLPASGGSSRWDPVAHRNVINNIEFVVPKGKHHLLVRIPRCLPAEVDFDADEITGADVNGILHKDTKTVYRGPEGTPDWWRVGISLWLPGSFGRVEQGVRLPQAFQYSALQNLGYRVSGTGFMVQPAIAHRFFTAGIDFGYSGGHAEARVSGSPPSTVQSAISQNPDLSWVRIAARLGFRLPLHWAAWHIGVSGGYDDIAVTKLPANVFWDRTDNFFAGVWTMVDVGYLCDYPLFASFHTDLQLAGNTFATYGIQIGAAMQPNARCTKDRNLKFGLTAKRGEGGKR